MEWYCNATLSLQPSTPAAAAGSEGAGAALDAGAARSANVLAGYLVDLFTAAFVANTIPDSWATLTTTPLYKKGDPADTSNCRPVAVGTLVARIYAGIYIIV